MSAPMSDRNLLVGILALQMDFIDRDVLIAAMHAWVLDKTHPLEQILSNQGRLSAEHRALLEAMVAAHLKAHGNDAGQSLQALSSIPTGCEDLASLCDDALLASLARVALRTPDQMASGPSWSRPGNSRAALRYRVLRSHARGGLGEVFVAEDTELHREVALKEIQTRFADHLESRSRFVLEAEVTGGLEHPGIVPVYGLGTYADGRPFYAMRFIQGDSLQDAIAQFHQTEKPGRDPGERSLALRQLLGRFVAVCQAVAYAHNRGVLHRDLKPSNVMLGKYGETLVVDWGLAKTAGYSDREPGVVEKALQPVSAVQVYPTEVGSVIGTPAYMSPEQAAGELDRLSPASDVYSLGATLYTLLTGKAPVTGAGLLQVVERVRRGEIPPPRQVNRSVPPALEAVCQKAMTLRPEDRYPSAQALADDIDHWLADEPVTAHREAFAVRAARWVRRHRAISVGTLVLLLTATAGLGVGLYLVNAEKNRTEQARQGEAAQRQLAEQSAAEAREVLEFFQNQVLAAARPENQDGGLGIHATIQDAVHAAEPKIAGAFGDRPLVEASIRNALGTTYVYLREDKTAIKQLERALQLRRDHLGLDHPDTLTSMNNLALAYHNTGQLDKDMPLLEQTLAKRKEKLGSNHPDTLQSMNNLAAAHGTVGQRGQSLPLLEQMLAKQKEKLGPDHPQTLISMNNLAKAYQNAGQPAQAVPLFEQTLAKYKEQFGPDHPDTLTIMNNLATAYQESGQPAKALPLLEQTLAQQREKLGPDHPNTLTSMNNLATAYWTVGQRAKAVPLFEQTLAQQREKLGPDHPNTLTSMNNLALAYQATGQLDKALPLLEQTVAKFKEKFGPDHPNTLTIMSNLATVYQESGQPAKALPLLEETLAKQKEKLGPDHPNTLTSMNNLGTAYQAAGQLDKALPLLEETLAKQTEKLGPDHPQTLNSMNNLAKAYEAAGQLDKALPLLEETLAKQTEKLGPDHPNTLTSMSNLATAYWDAGQRARAVPLFEQTLAKQKEKLGPDHPQTLISMNNLATVYQAAGQLDKALPLFEQTLAKFKEKLGPDHPNTLTSINNLASAYLKNSDFAKAEQILRESLTLRQQKQPDAWRTFYTQSQLGASLLGQKHYTEAEPLLRTGYEGMKQREAKIPAGAKKFLTETLERLVQLYDAWGKPEQTKLWRQKLEQAKTTPKNLTK